MIRTGCMLMISAALLATSAHSEDAAKPNIEDSIKTAVATNLAEDRKPSQSVEACWAAWKESQGLNEGKNDLNGHLILLSHQQQAVNADPGARNWLSARNAAFSQAEIAARAALARTMSTTIKSDRSAAVQQFGGDDPPPSLKPIVKQLSIVDKADLLAGKALDHEISRYDPNWNANASEADKKQAAIVLQSRVQESVAARAQLFASGAFTVTQCEGMSEQDNGKYSVLVGLVWSPKLAKVAEAVWNPDYNVAPETADAPLEEQMKSFERADPDWLAYSLGARVFTNEKGERVVVGFGVAPQSSLMSADRSRANLAALAAIQRFVAEKVVAKQDNEGAFEQQDDVEGKIRTFDNNKYLERTELLSPEMKLAGVTEVTSWRGEHPWSHAKMQVVAVAWTKSWSADSLKTEQMMTSIEQRMSGQGAVPQMPADKGQVSKSGGSAAPTHSGASSKTRNF